MSRILQITTFPTLRPRHGGQRRANETALALEAAGHQVRRVGAFVLGYYAGQPSQPAFELGGFPPPQHPTTWLFDGVRFLTGDPARLKDFIALCLAEPADLLMLEEPWLWPAVRQIPAVASGALPVFYNSYNIEAPVFRQLLDRAEHPSAAMLAREMADSEADLARHAIACTAVTEADAGALRALGARNVAVAPNGVAPRNRAHLRGALPQGVSPDWRYVLYVASAHPPNASGIPELFNAMLLALRPLERLVVCGGVALLINQWLAKGGPAHLIHGRLVLLGELSDLALDGLIANATGFVLPLREGGGSNLKTAEALFSGLPIVATGTAMRGYEAYRDAGGVIMADSAADFAAGMRRLFEESPPPRLPGPALDALRWTNTLQPLVELTGTVLS